MRIKIRIYNRYDLDIIALAEAKNFSVSNAMKETLKYYAAGKRYLIEIPILPETLENDRYMRGFYVELDDEKDKEAVNFIKSIPEGYRNAFMKNIFRASFEVSPFSLYMGHGSAEYIAKMISNPRIGKHPVQREIIDPISLSEGEIGVTISNTVHEKSLPRGEKVKKTTKKETQKHRSGNTLRDLTKSAYDNANSTNKMQTNEKTNMAAEIEKRKQSIEDDLDDFMDSIM